MSTHLGKESSTACVVLHAHSRRVVGWSIGRQQAGSLATSPRGDNEQHAKGSGRRGIHSGRSSRGGLKWSPGHVDREVRT